MVFKKKQIKMDVHIEFHLERPIEEKDRYYIVFINVAGNKGRTGWIDKGEFNLNKFLSKIPKPFRKHVKYQGHREFSKEEYYKEKRGIPPII